ncbi:CesT family type III secretion system chaperone [Ottowia thiooxydans]|uniref:CesT family type III secretion system chaperone n=1 Tax=Ottowia thiooxydans TaxID=219182 RepID=UPI00041ADC30|nr:CesT family type III secretion system chaperone [Ottowia thiooxydans]
MILAEYAATLGEDAPFTGTRLTMTVDGRYRLQLLERQDGRVLVRTRLRSLPAPGPARDEVLRNFGLLACGRMISAPVACAVDAQERGLWLQQLCDAGSTQILDEQVGAFVNELAFWVSAVQSD